MTVLGKPVELELKNILFATDFSPSAEGARFYVKALAQRYSSRVVVMHVVDLATPFRTPDAGMCIEMFRHFGAESLARVQADLASDGIRCDVLLSESTDPPKVILAASHDQPIDLLVIGTRAHKGLAKLVLGSTAEILIHRAECPVLTLGPEAQAPKLPLSFQNIVYATDFSAGAARAAVFALSFAEESGAHIYLCHVLPGDGEKRDHDDRREEFSQSLESLIPDVAREWCQPECVVEYGHAADGILLLAQRVRADLIVLGTRKDSHWFDNFKTGVALQVIGAAKAPVLTVRG